MLNHMGATGGRGHADTEPAAGVSAPSTGAIDGDAGEPGDVGHLHPAQAPMVDAIAGVPGAQLLERDAALETREVGADAHVDAVAEAEGH